MKKNAAFINSNETGKYMTTDQQTIEEKRLSKQTQTVAKYSRTDKTDKVNRGIQSGRQELPR